MPIDQSVLRQKAFSYDRRLHEGLRTSASVGTMRRAFLCHSHQDEALVQGLTVIFREAGIDLYIDWQDHSMPETPNTETAQRIQHKIKECDIFLFLATANSKASRWCPWEIGYADSSQKRIYVIPTLEGAASYGNEYLDLYKSIDAASSPNGKIGYALFSRGQTDAEWISNESLRSHR